MAQDRIDSTKALQAIRWPLRLTRWGMVAERATRAFWPLWSWLFAAMALLGFGLHDWLMPGGTLLLAGVFLAGTAGLIWWGARRFRWPDASQVLARLDATLPGRPLAALGDRQAVGAGDAASNQVWRVHQERMARQARQARAVRPDLRVAQRDPFGLRYLALSALIAALLFGSIWRVADLSDSLSGPGAALASGPAWEGWIEPPAHTGRPSLYLNDIAAGELQVPADSRVSLRLYGELGALEVHESVSGQLVPETEAGQSNFDVTRNGHIRIDGTGGRVWEVIVLADTPPEIVIDKPMEPGRGGDIMQPFRGMDDYGVLTGKVEITLDLQALERRHGLRAEPEPRAPIVVDLPMPITGERTDFEETFVDNFSQHPWARMPVRLRFSVEDAAGQSSAGTEVMANLGGRRFFDPLAAALIEQRRDLLWTRQNAPRVLQVLRAISHRPDDVFPDSGSFLRFRTLRKRLSGGLDQGLTPELRDEIAQALWDLALKIEEGDLADALKRLRRAQDRLSEAMRRGADEAEIAELMEELREAMRDYIRQLAEQQGGEDRQNAETPDSQQQTQELTQQDLQQMMDRIQELMEQGRMAEAMQMLDELRQMMENLQVTQGQGGQQSPGQQAMDGLAETLRNQQGLSDDAFRDLQEQFNPGAQAGESPENQGRDGGQGRGQQHGQQRGQGGQSEDGAEEGAGGVEPGPEGRPGGEATLAERQRRLQQELDRQQQNLPGLGGEAGRATRDALDRAGRAMGRAEERLRDDDLAGAIDDQAEALDALREGMRNLGEALAQQQQQGGDPERAAGSSQPGNRLDPLGRDPGGREGRINNGDTALPDARGQANALRDEIRRRSGDQERPAPERNYLRRLLERF